MELWTKEVQINEQGNLITDQFVIDEDVNVPDSKRDFVRIIMSKANMKVDELRTVENHVCVKGKLEYQILYAGEGLEPMISSLAGRLPFEEIVYVDEGQGRYDIKEMRVDMHAAMIHSRKIRIKALVELELMSQKEIMDEILLDVEGDGLYKKKSALELLLLHDRKKDTYRIKEEIVLPGTKETIAGLLWTDIQNRKLDTKLEMDDFVLVGELQVFCFYESPDGKIDWIEQAVPYQGRITCNGAEPGMYHEVRADLEDVYAEARMDEDGEMRIIGVEGTLKLFLTIYKEEKMEILEDVYSLEKQCKLESKELLCEKLILQNHSKCKLAQKLSLPELRGNVLQICHSRGLIQLDQVKAMEDGILVEGALQISFLYVKANDEVPFDTWHGVVPFSYLIECKYSTESMRYHISSLLEQLSITLLGGDEVEVKAVLAFHSFFREAKMQTVIQNIQMEPLEMKKVEKQPGVIGYIVKSEDDLWTLAKHYGTTMESIQQVNNMQSETLKVGDRILIFRENMSIL